MSEDFAAHLAGLRQDALVAVYRLEAQVGAGGMAVVSRARDERLGRLVALKVLAPALAADRAFRQRFIGESRAAAVVDDPHIIPIYEAGEVGVVLFIAMRFVRGGDLRLVLEREGALPPGRAAEFISPMASALDAAHAAGLVHRDVKPANILIGVPRKRPARRGTGTCRVCATVSRWSAAKAGVQGFTWTLAIELGPFGITAKLDRARLVVSIPGPGRSSHRGPGCR